MAKNKYWITDKSPTIQDNIPNKVITINNQLLKDNDIIFIIFKN